MEASAEVDYDSNEYTEGVEGVLTYKNYGDYIEISRCDRSTDGEIEISAEINGIPVTFIGDLGFNFCKNLTLITIPDSVTSIGNMAF